MRGKLVLITGGAGFIGSHLADELLNHGYRVRALDLLHEQVHGPLHTKPAYLNADVEFVEGDVRAPDVVRRALQGADAVAHLAAAVGVGQSMYQIAAYTSHNGLGTAVLLEALAEKRVEKLLVASSMSIYGEGLYCGENGARFEDVERTLDQLKRRDWRVYDGQGGALIPAPTPETKRPRLSSVYALSKYNQEQLCLMLGRALGIPTVALRFFNVYGTRQALSNPYTGVLAIFASRLLNRRPPLIFEDGNQQRDFVSVQDVSRACRLALESERCGGQTINIGSGRPRTVGQVAESMGRVLNRPEIEAVVTGSYRVGDIRHCFADISLARSLLGYEPQVAFEDGLLALSEWLQGQMAEDRVETARNELAVRGLTV